MSNGRLYERDTAEVLRLHGLGTTAEQIASAIDRPELLVWRVLAKNGFSDAGA